MDTLILFTLQKFLITASLVDQMGTNDCRHVLNSRSNCKRSKVATAIHLQGMKSPDLLVSRLNSLAFQGIIIVQYHRIQTQLNHSGTSLLQSPDEQLLQQITKEVDLHKRELCKKSFHRMRGGKVFLTACQQRGITLISFEMIETAEATDAAVHEKTKYLQKEIRDCNPFFVFTH